MDSFHEPHRVPEPIKLEDLTAEVLARSAEYHAKGIPLSGRIIHVCHYLPITATLQQSSRPGILSPPATPPHQLANIPLLPSQPTSSSGHGPGHNNSRPKWSLSVRQGHTAMISGIRSLSATYEQVIIGWTGDFESPNTNSGMWTVTPLHHIIRSSHAHIHAAGEKFKIPSTTLSEEDKTALEEDIANFKSEDEDPKTTITYLPVLLDDKVAHGHYDGYCKQSEIVTNCQFCLSLCRVFFSSLATLPLSPLAGCLAHITLLVFLGG